MDGMVLRSGRLTIPCPCGREAYARGRCLRCYKRARKAGEISKIPRLSIDEIFATYAHETVPNERIGTDCILWTGKRNDHGYGMISRRRAHRVAWERKNGPIPDGLFVCHKCDNPQCVNVNHLFLGTHMDNMKDMAGKDRSFAHRHPERLARGERNGFSKLNVQKVLAIRASSLPQRAAAKEFNVSQCAVWNIRNRKTWGHVP